jgi:hypothetical protein
MRMKKRIVIIDYGVGLAPQPGASSEQEGGGDGYV